MDNSTIIPLSLSCEIIRTNDYGKFRILKGNRNTEHAKKIGASIDKNGYIPNPIVVNEKMEIIDGQGRFEAAKERNLPIYYCVLSGSGIPECAAMNIASTNWSLKDWAHSYAEQGIESYVIVDEFFIKHPHLAIDVALSILSGSFTKGNLNKKLREGNFEVNSSVERANEIANADELVMGIVKKAPHVYKTQMLQAFNFVYEHANVDNNRLIERLRYIDVHTEAATVRACLTILEDLYNRNLSQKNKVSFIPIYNSLIADSNEKNLARWLV